jgi:hypothetical protein
MTWRRRIRRRMSLPLRRRHAPRGLRPVSRGFAARGFATHAGGAT